MNRYASTVVLVSTCFVFVLHWSDAASLSALSNGLIIDDSSTIEPILSRRRPVLAAIERRRRWMKVSADDDEMEILPESLTINQFEKTTESIEISLNSDQTESDENLRTTTSQLDLQTTNGFLEINSTSTESTEFQSTNSITTEHEKIIKKDETIIDESNFYNDSATSLSSTDSTELTTLPIEQNSIVDETTTLAVSNQIETTLSDVTQEQDLTLLQTTMEMLSSSSSSSLSNVTTLDEILSTETTSEIPISINVTMTEEIVLLETTTEIMSLFNMTMTEETVSLETTTEMASSFNTTMTEETTEISFSSNVTLTEETFFIETTRINSTSDIESAEINSSTWSSLSSDETTDNDDFNLITTIPTTEVRPKPACDLSCRCSKKCLNGFKIIDDQCQCESPCEEYKCFFDDVCTVNSDDRPSCEPNNETEHERPKRCYQPADAGFHDEIIQYHNRWFYNPEQDTCHLFVYRGLGGNENNFLSLNDCNLECIICASPPSRGTCQGSIQMWYYDHKNSKCSSFEYSGCRGNDNRFYKEQQCIDTCVTRVLNF